jgi:hypothetical protein
MPKPLYYIYAFSYFALNVVVMDFFRLWWLINEYIFFREFIYICYISYLGKNSYHMLLEPI